MVRRVRGRARWVHLRGWVQPRERRAHLADSVRALRPDRECLGGDDADEPPDFLRLRGSRGEALRGWRVFHDDPHAIKFPGLL